MPGYKYLAALQLIKIISYFGLPTSGFRLYLIFHRNASPLYISILPEKENMTDLSRF